MRTDGSATIYVRFAILSFIVATLLAGSLAFLLYQFAGSSHDEAAAQGAASAFGEPLRQSVADVPTGAPLPSDLRDRFDQLSRGVSGGGVLALRVWGEEGGPALSSGFAAPATRGPLPGGGVSWVRGTAPNGVPLLVTRVRAGAYSVEIDQDARPIDAATRRARATLLLAVAAFALGAYAAMQAAFWIAVGRFAAGHRRLSYLYRRGDEIRSSLDLQEVVTHVSRDATRLARGSYGLLALFDEVSGDVILRTTYEDATGTIAQHQRPVEEWFLRRAVATNTTVVSSQPASAYRQFFGAETELAGQLSVLCVPMSLRARVIGVIAVVRPLNGRRGFSATEIAQVEELAGQAVMAVEQAQLFAKVRAYASEIELSYDATLKALMAALDAKDEVTEGHCERVAKLTLHLAREMGIPDEQMLDIERGALLHDVGKIGVPDAVLKKPEGLNDLEWEAMRKHPLLAGLMVSKIGFLEGSMPILLYHHERYDGTGYPFGLTADRIPLEARIFSVVDAYDAMTSDRPYRDAMTHDVAMAEVDENSGLQFDPDVVQAFRKMMEARPELRHDTPHRLPAEHDEHDFPDGADEDAA